MMQTKGIMLLAVCTALAGLPGCNSFFSSPSASHVAYVTVPNTGIAAYRVDTKSGSSTNILGSPFPTGNSPFSIQVHPTKRFLYVANAADNTISLFKIDPSSGALTEVTPPTQTALSPGSLTMDSGGAFLFVANHGSNSISVFSIDAGSGALQAITNSPFATYTHPNLLTVSPTGKYLYMLDTNLALVAIYSITSGQLEEVANSPVSVGASPFALAVDPAEHFMYVTNSGTGAGTNGTVSVYTIDPVSGALSVIPDSATPTGITPIAALVHPGGKFLYVANSGGNNVSQFSIDATTGTLTELTTANVATGTTPVFIVFDPISGFVDVGNQDSKNVTEYTVNLTTGVLASTNTLLTNDPPTAMAFGK